MYKIGRLNAEEVAAAAYSQFGIVADDQEIAAFARWVLEQGGRSELVKALEGARHLLENFEGLSKNNIDNLAGEVLVEIDEALAAAGAA
jgi:hypothetical protein